MNLDLFIKRIVDVYNKYKNMYSDDKMYIHFSFDNDLDILKTEQITYSRIMLGDEFLGIDIYIDNLEACKINKIMSLRDLIIYLTDIYNDNYLLKDNNMDLILNISIKDGNHYINNDDFKIDIKEHVDYVDIFIYQQ